MKKNGIKQFVLHLTLIFSLSSLIPAQADNLSKILPKQTKAISYDKSNDRLSVDVQNVSLKLLLGKISRQSGMEVLFDDAAEEKLSMEIGPVPLEQGLKNILRSQNFIFRYNKDENENQLLVGVMVLPKGTQDTGRAKRVIAIDNEAYNRTLSQMSLEQTNKIDKANERWQSRMKDMSPERRTAMENRIKKRIVSNEKRKQRLDEKQKTREKRHAQSEAKRQKLLTSRQNDIDPETLTEKKQRTRETQEKLKAQLLPQLQ